MQDEEVRRRRRSLTMVVSRTSTKKAEGGITSSRLSSRHFAGLAMMLTLLSFIASFPIRVVGGSATGELIVSPIMIQPRQPIPPHKLRMLLGPEDTDEARRKLADPQANLPLHAGYGTHFAFLYVGTPAQRVSVILDTGSHWTAFPCTGCK